jgi:hypothetical protein
VLFRWNRRTGWARAEPDGPFGAGQGWLARATGYGDLAHQAHGRAAHGVSLDGTAGWRLVATWYPRGPLPQRPVSRSVFSGGRSLGTQRDATGSLPRGRKTGEL